MITSASVTSVPTKPRALVPRANSTHWPTVSELRGERSARLEIRMESDTFFNLATPFPWTESHAIKASRPHE